MERRKNGGGSSGGGGDGGELNKLGAAEQGRKEMLARRMFELKRFDSAEYIITPEKQAYLDNLKKTELYEQQHHLDHQHFEHHHHHEQQKHQTGVKEHAHPLHTEQRASESLNLTSQGKNAQIKQMAQSEAGKRAMLRRKIGHTRRFDSGEYFAGIENDEDVLARSPVRVNIDRNSATCKNSTDSSSIHNARTLGDNEDPMAGWDQQQSPNMLRRPKGKGKSAIVVKRFLQKKNARKRWDSGDFNALLKKTNDNDDNDETNNTKPDLDVMSHSSAEQSDSGYTSHETKFDEELTDGPTVTATSNRKCHRSKSSHNLLPRRSGSAMSSEKPAKLQVFTPPPNRMKRVSRFPEPTSPLEVTQYVAKEQFNYHQTRSRRFDSADYFRGLSPPSQECEVPSVMESPSSAPVRATKLGKSTLALRELRAEKLKRERDLKNC